MVDLTPLGHYAANRAYTTNGRNQYITVGDRTYAYDSNGNLTSDGANTWPYDNENRLVGAGAATLAYDPLGLLCSRTLCLPSLRLCVIFGAFGPLPSRLDLR